MNIKELTDFAKIYEYKNLPICFNDDPYTRIPIYKNNDFEIVLICFKEGQTSSVHHHRGSNCVVKVIQGKVLETLFAEQDDGLTPMDNHVLKEGEISGLEGKQVHQLCNISKNGTVLLNFYSPPFEINQCTTSGQSSEQVLLESQQ